VTSKATGPSKGFSLIEILVVITIIIIISAATIPLGLNYVKHYKITGAAQGIAAEIQRARAQAVKRNTSKGILLNFNYPETAAYQFTSLDPDPRTGNWDGEVYPANPGNCNNSPVLYGMVPDPPNNLVDPNTVGGVQSPHGFPTELPQDILFDDGVLNALLFCADGSVAAVNASGSVGDAALTLDDNGFDWIMILRDRTTQLTRTIRISPGGRVVVEPQ
jgi:prepilin-type N-terminal cleavage/methylation domain-containing protein